MHIQFSILILALLTPLTLTAPTPEPNIDAAVLRSRQLPGGITGTTGTTGGTTGGTTRTTGTTSGLGSGISSGLGAATEGIGLVEQIFSLIKGFIPAK